MKVNKSNDVDTIVCPKCGATSEIIRISSITVDSTPILLHDDVGEIYQCMNPVCREYLEKVNDDFKVIKKSEIFKRQSDITEMLATEAKFTKDRLFPKFAELDAGRVLSGTLYALTAGSVFRRPYTVDEILEACAAVGLHPSSVDNSTIPYVVAWLEEHKGK